jgi:SpoVK/Ycf46/Vps4 family AAA+-type ATPase
MSDNFSEKLKNLYLNDEKIRHRIKDLPALLNSLDELDSMIGMNSFKEDVIDCIKTYIWNCVEMDENGKPVKQGRQHIIISGPPGCGKTTLAKHIAKIFVSLGYIKKREKTDVFDNLSGRIFRNEIFIQLFIVLTMVLITKFSWWMAVIYFCVVIVLLLIPTDNKRDDTGDDFFIVAKREDFVDKYVGGTAPRTKAFLDKCVGKVVFIDEAYNLINGTNFDNYGKEALTGILQFMDDHEEQCLFIFGGYKEEMDKSIFAVQPGLKRRFTQIFTVKGYTPEELSQIFIMQLSNFSLTINENEEYIDLFRDNIKYFPFYGGDTERLATYVKKIHSRRMFDHAMNKGSIKKTDVSRDMIIEGISILSRAHQESEKNNKTGISLDSLLESFNQKIVE